MAGPPTDIKKIAIKLGTDGPVKTLAGNRMVRVLFGGIYIISTANAKYVWEHPYFPQWYVPKKDLIDSSKHAQFEIEEGEQFKSESGSHVGTQLTIKAGGKSTDKVIAFSDNLKHKAEELNGLVKIDFTSMDQWFEEDTPIYVHPKDPFKRIDILQSNRPVKVSIDGQVIASSTTSMHLHETGLPTRFYMPLTSLDSSILQSSKTKTKCPYKGEAEYLSVEVNGKVYEDIFWYYTNPTVESSKVQGLCCPYNERVDIELDGHKLDRPKTLFGPPKENKKPSII